MIVKLLNLYLPVDLVLRSVFDGDGQVTSVIETSEFTDRNQSSIHSTCFRFLRIRLLFRLVETHNFTSESISFLEDF